MVLTRATDNRLKTLFTAGEIRYGAAAFQGKGFRSLGQEAIYAAAIRLRRGKPYRTGNAVRRTSGLDRRRHRSGDPRPRSHARDASGARDGAHGPQRADGQIRRAARGQGSAHRRLPIVGAQEAREQPALLEPGDQAGRGALAEDGVRDLVHPQMTARPVVSLAEHIEDLELPDAEVVRGLKRALDVRLDTAVQCGQGAPALCQPGGPPGGRRARPLPIAGPPSAASPAFPVSAASSKASLRVQRPRRPPRRNIRRLLLTRVCNYCVRS